MEEKYSFGNNLAWANLDLMARGMTSSWQFAMNWQRSSVCVSLPTKQNVRKGIKVLEPTQQYPSKWVSTYINHLTESEVGRGFDNNAGLIEFL